MVRRPVAGTAPWLRGPLLLLQQPMAVAAVMAAAGVLGLVLAAGPLFVSSVGTAALHSAAGKRCVQENQIAVINPSLNPYRTLAAGPQDAGRVRAADPVIRDAFARKGLPAPLLTMYSAVSTGDRSGLRPTEVGLFASPDALQRVHVVSRISGAGVYVTDTYAAQLGLRAGDRLPLASGGVRIAGVYRDLDDAGYRTVLPAYWCHWRNLIVKSVSSRPPPFVLADAATVAAVGADIQAEWTSPTDIDSLTVAEAEELAAAGRGLFAVEQIDPENAQSVVAGYTERTQLDFNLQLTAELRGAVGTPVLSIAAAAGLLSLALLGGAVLLWAHRRQSELALLSVRGVGPVALGGKAVAELALPVGLGCVTGWAGGLLLIPWLGPSPLIEPGGPARALLAAGGGWLVGVLTVLLVAAARFAESRRRDSAPVGWAAAGAVPVLLGVAAWLFADAERRQLILPGVYRIDPALLLAPVLGLTGLVLAAALLAAAPLPRVRGAARRWAFPAFAAVNRAAAARGPLIVVLCALAVPIGLGVYGAGFTASTAATVTAKAHAYTGAPVVLDLRVGLGELPDVGGGATPVSYTRAAIVGTEAGAVDDGGDEVQLLGVDPDSFARYAYADPEVTGTPLPELLGRLADPPADGAAAALLVGAAEAPAPTAVQVRSTTLPVTVVERVPAFPGLRYPQRPAVVVTLGALSGLDPFGNWRNELWTDQAHAGQVLADLSRQSVLTDDVQQPETFLDATSLLPVAWTFQFLQAVSVVIAAVSAAGLLLFLAARQDREQTGYILMKRMGMSGAAYLRSLLLELATLTGWAWLSGALSGSLALLTATRAIDPNPGFLPPTLLRLPFATAAWSAFGLAALTVALAWLTQHHADRAHPATVLRR